MGKIYALLVGVDDYPSHTAPSPLTGCVNDVTEARRLLTDRTGGSADVRVLLNADATTAAVTDAIERHLGAAGPDDTALFWFSGHGTQSRATGADLLVEATGRNQAVVCVDGPLSDKRLGALLDAVAADGAHTAAVLDCCYSGGATRDADLTARCAPPAPGWDLAPASGAREAVVPDGPPRHVLLAASRLNQLSYEGYFGGRRHGAFTHALLGVLREAGPDATYRRILAAADARLQRAGGTQQPVLYPPEADGVADRPFLGGAVARTPSTHLLRYGPAGWEVDCGSGHGLREGAGASGTEFTVLAEAGLPDAAAPPGVVRARTVHGHRTLVDPVDWTPSAGRVYPVALSALAAAPATAALDTAERPELSSVLYDAVGAVSPLLRVVATAQEAADLHFRVVVRGPSAHVLRRDGTPFVEPLLLTGRADAGRVADCLAHLARWHQLRDLTPRPSLLDGLVRVEITPWDAPDGGPLLPDGSGEIVCPYTHGPEGPQGPLVTVRLHNRSPDRTLWCLLLDLTDRYAADPALYPGHFIGPGGTGHALDGEPVQLSLPHGRPAVPGAQARDWLKLVVAEGELNTLPFQLPAWDPRGAGARADRFTTDDGVLRLRPHAVREFRRVGAGAPGRWTTRVIPVRTVVP
ncbi:caspase family protein [Streptomyces luteocolor]|uniref:caspase family protein n=1 Tax=Streptomyces luteocolor TaxID=285500 RepID=UPI000853128B|nr:caspase family protein [Streptomyces luteocolor]